MNLEMTNLSGVVKFILMDEAHTGLGLIFLLLAFAVCGGIVIWLIVSEGIRHTRTTGGDSAGSPSSH